jgi:hypothetical protein
MAAAQFNFDPSKILMAIIIAVLVMALVSTCQTNLILHDDITELNGINDEYSKRIYDDSLVVYSQKQNILSKDAAIKMLQEDAERLRLKNLQELVKVNTKTIIKTEIQLGEPIYIDSFPHLKLPREFSKVDKWLTIDGTINRLGLLQIDSIASYGTLTYAVGDSARDGFISNIFGRRDKVVRLSIDNPNMTITGISNLYIRDEKKWWQSKGFAFILGAAIGGGIIFQATK